MAPHFGCSNVQVFARGKGLAAVTADSRPHGGADVLDVGGSGGPVDHRPGPRRRTAGDRQRLPVASTAAVTAFRLPAA